MYQFGIRRLAETDIFWHLEWPGRVGHNPIDPTPIASPVEVLGIVMVMTRSPFGVFNELAVIVDQVERAVGTNIKIHRPKPAIGGSQKLDSLAKTTGDEG